MPELRGFGLGVPELQLGRRAFTIPRLNEGEKPTASPTDGDFKIPERLYAKLALAREGKTRIAANVPE
ncbi:hypothetical protein C7438_0695 [Brockia lithotrophica]|uniref:Uncharacterized protein n=1 Tax=Brockia lithotrophica TaxID=933949 RepID=A0A660L852_9BACL|nr:hypothetical protein C7438_0695 [Brockia lithotrophica]